MSQSELEEQSSYNLCQKYNFKLLFFVKEISGLLDNFTHRHQKENFYIYIFGI